jgi:hypothetical protein
MSDLPAGECRAVMNRIWEQLDRRGYADCTDEDLGASPGLRDDVISHYYEEAMRSTLPQVRDVPADRSRIRDVISYSWAGAGALDLSEHDLIALTDRGGQLGVRQYPRVMALADPMLTRWIEILISLVPPNRRRIRGSFSLNFMRTHTLTVAKPHRDDEDFVITYVIARSGDGAESQIIAPKTREVVHAIQLDPGQLLISDDRRFLHYTTPLDPHFGKEAHRDTMVCTTT